MAFDSRFLSKYAQKYGSQRWDEMIPLFPCHKTWRIEGGLYFQSTNVKGRDNLRIVLCSVAINNASSSRRVSFSGSFPCDLDNRRRCLLEEYEFHISLETIHVTLSFR